MAQHQTYRGLAQEVCVVVNGQERQLLQVFCHQGGRAVEERFQLLLFLVAWHLLTLVALVEDGLDLGEPPEHTAQGLITCLLQ